MGECDEALKVLEQALTHRDGWLRLHAAIVLDMLDEEARPVLPALKAAMVKQPNKYIVRVANRAVNDLQGTNNVVP